MAETKNIVLTLNDKNQAMLLHDVRFDFKPAWVEFSRDKRGVRIISDEGKEFTAGVLIDLVTWEQLDPICDVLLVRMENQKPVEGFLLPFISQHYDTVKPAGGMKYVNGW